MSEHRVDIPAGTAVDQDISEDLAAGLARTREIDQQDRLLLIRRAQALHHLQVLADEDAPLTRLSARELQIILGLA